MRFNPSSDASSATYLDLRHAGWWFYGEAGISLNQADIQLAHCTISNCAYAALNLSLSSRPWVTSCTLANNGGLAVDNAMLESVPRFLGNSAHGNAGGDYLEVADPSPASDVTISPASCLNGALYFATGATIPSGVSVTLQPGVVIKGALGYGVSVYGSLNLLGTAFQPVVFTSMKDDSWGGDTNHDGPSFGAPGDWESIRYLSTAAASRVENVLLRYGGHNYAAPMMSCASAAVNLRSLRAEHGFGGAIEASAHQGDAENWVAFACAGTGIHLTGGSFDLVHATAANNGGAGVRNNGFFSGQVHNSIAWANAGANFDGFSPGKLFHCDGSAAHAGSNGNLNLDPLFVDPSVATGDLRLGPGSPCVDTANTALASAVIKDHGENSRLLDSGLDGTLRPDMGAYEKAIWAMSVGGAPQIGTTLTFTVSGPLPGVSIYWVGLADGYALTPYGYLCTGSSAVRAGNARVGTPLAVDIPDDPFLVGTQIGVQTVTIFGRIGGMARSPLSDLGTGQVTNLFRATLLP
jgi:hypothetical protein